MEAQAARIVYKFSDLEVWQKAFAISLDVHRESLNFPKIEQYALANQMRRASKSICANIAEGFSKQMASKAEFKRFLQMALGSGNEMILWIMYCKELGYITAEKSVLWQDEYTRICRMLNSLGTKA